jgi:hypothetical protein
MREEVTEPLHLTEKERNELFELVGRGVLEIVRTLPDGRMVLRLSEMAADYMEQPQ